MAPELFAALEQLAVETNSIARRGPNARKPSWYVMIERIAKGEILVSERVPWSLPAGLAEQADKIEREQERQRGLDEAVKAMADLRREQERKTPALKPAQMNMLPELEPV
jgi:hypothetical protein